MAEVGAGFLLSPAALRVSMPAGIPIFARLEEAGRTAGLALGVATRPSLGVRPHHFYFPSPPAIAPGLPTREAIDLLLTGLRGLGGAEAVFDSFDAPAELAWPDGARPGHARREYQLSTDRSPEALLAAFAANHRTRVRRGEREGWALRMLSPVEGARLLREALGVAAARAAARGQRMNVPTEASVTYPAADPSAPSGMRVFAACDGEGPLAVALIGWGGQRTYDIMGGSTERGYQLAGAPWLHWRLMSFFASYGRTTYSFGGTTADAERPDHPGHGLHLFKLGFGTQTVACRGAAWRLRPTLVRAHQAVRWLATCLPVEVG